MTAASLILLSVSVAIFATIVAKSVALPLTVETGLAFVGLSALASGVRGLNDLPPTMPTVFCGLAGAALVAAGMMRRRRLGQATKKTPRGTIEAPRG